MKHRGHGSVPQRCRVLLYCPDVYLVDFSPSLCMIVPKRFARLGWNNIIIICEDARKFNIDEFWC